MIPAYGIWLSQIGFLTLIGCWPGRSLDAILSLPFNVMSDLAFGKPFSMLESAANHFAIDPVRDGTNLLRLACGYHG